MTKIKRLDEVDKSEILAKVASGFDGRMTVDASDARMAVSRAINETMRKLAFKNGLKLED